MTESSQRDQSGVLAARLPGGSAPVSLCIISGGEERRIGRALESVSGWTSEIIVVLNEEARDGTEENPHWVFSVLVFSGLAFI
jgi:hypothetical protein